MFEEEFKLIALNQKENLRTASSIVTNLDFIEHYKDYLDWRILSSREDLINNPEFCDRFKDKIYWTEECFYAPWDIFWKYRNYSLKPEDNCFKPIDHYIRLTKTYKEKCKILEDILQDSKEYDEEVTMCLEFPTDINFIRKHEDRIVWDRLYAVLDKENLQLFSEFKDKINWSQFENKIYWIVSDEILSWVWDNVGDKINWDNVFIMNDIEIPISSLRLVKSAIKEFTWAEFCHKEYCLEYSLKYLEEGVTRPEHFDWFMIGEFIIKAYRYNLESYKKIVDLRFIEKYQSYIPWEKLISSWNYDKNLIVEKIMPKKTRKRLGYHILFRIIFKLKKKESKKP